MSPLVRMKKSRMPTRQGMASGGAVFLAEMGNQQRDDQFRVEDGLPRRFSSIIVIDDLLDSSYSSFSTQSSS